MRRLLLFFWGESIFFGWGFQKKTLKLLGIGSMWHHSENLSNADPS
jgi:hypothetical protein